MELLANGDIFDAANDSEEADGDNDRLDGYVEQL